MPARLCKGCNQPFIRYHTVVARPWNILERSDYCLDCLEAETPIEEMEIDEYMRLGVERLADGLELLQGQSVYNGAFYDLYDEVLFYAPEED